MKALRALTLVLILSVTASAGDMDNGRSSGVPMDNGRPTDGIMDNGRSANPAPTGDKFAVATPEAEPSITEAALSVLQSILSLF